VAVWSIIHTSEIDIKDRFDAEYFQPKFLEVAMKVHEDDWPTLGEICNVTASAFYPAATELYSRGEIPFIRCVDTINYPVISDIQTDKFKRLPQDFLSSHKNLKTMRNGDVVITKVGTPCYASVIDTSLGKVVLSRTVLGLKNIRIDPHYLVAFLRSKYGFYQLMRERELIIQLQLTLERVKRIKVFIPRNKRHVINISNRLKEHCSYLRHSMMKYNRAKQMLLNELGVKNLDLSPSLFCAVNLKDVKEFHRLDAEYYQPKYERVIEHLKKNFDTKSLGEAIPDITTGQYCDEYVRHEGKPYIRGVDISNMSVNMDKLAYISPQRQVENKIAKEGDIVVSRVGTIGLSARLPKEVEGGTVSDNLIRLRFDQEKIDSYYLALFLGSDIGTNMMVRCSRGSVQQRLNQETLKEIPLPLLPMAKQKELADLVIQSHQARRKAKEFLEEAKKKVEYLIEGKGYAI